MLEAFAALGRGWYRGPPDGAKETTCTFEQGHVADAEGHLYALAGVHLERDVDLPDVPTKCWLELERSAADAAHAFIVDDTDYGVNPILFGECGLKPNLRLVSSMVIARGGGSAVPGLKYFSILARVEAIELWRTDHPGEVVFVDQALAEYLPRILERAESGASPQVDSQ